MQPDDNNYGGYDPYDAYAPNNGANMDNVGDPNLADPDLDGFVSVDMPDMRNNYDMQHGQDPNISNISNIPNDANFEHLQMDEMDNMDNIPDDFQDLHLEDVEDVEDVGDADEKSDMPDYSNFAAYAPEASASMDPMLPMHLMGGAMNPRGSIHSIQSKPTESVATPVSPLSAAVPSVSWQPRQSFQSLPSAVASRPVVLDPKLQLEFLELVRELAYLLRGRGSFTKILSVWRALRRNHNNYLPSMSLTAADIETYQEGMNTIAGCLVSMTSDADSDPDGSFLKQVVSQLSLNPTTLLLWCLHLWHPKAYYLDCMRAFGFVVPFLHNDKQMRAARQTAYTKDPQASQSFVCGLDLIAVFKEKYCHMLQIVLDSLDMFENVLEPLSQALPRYAAFLMLVAQEQDLNDLGREDEAEALRCELTPRVDMELLWHLHLLHPRQYYETCEKLYKVKMLQPNRKINYRSISYNSIIESDPRTHDLWTQAFRSFAESKLGISEYTKDAFDPVVKEPNSHNSHNSNNSNNGHNGSNRQIPLARYASHNSHMSRASRNSHAHRNNPNMPNNANMPNMGSNNNLNHGSSANNGPNGAQNALNPRLSHTRSFSHSPNRSPAHSVAGRNDRKPNQMHMQMQDAPIPSPRGSNRHSNAYHQHSRSKSQHPHVPRRRSSRPNSPNAPNGPNGSQGHPHLPDNASVRSGRAGHPPHVAHASHGSHASHASYASPRHGAAGAPAGQMMRESVSVRSLNNAASPRGAGAGRDRRHSRHDSMASNAQGGRRDSGRRDSGRRDSGRRDSGRRDSQRRGSRRDSHARRGRESMTQDYTIEYDSPLDRERNRLDSMPSQQGPGLHLVRSVSRGGDASPRSHRSPMSQMSPRSHKSHRSQMSGQGRTPGSPRTPGSMTGGKEGADGADGDNAHARQMTMSEVAMEEFELRYGRKKEGPGHVKVGSRVMSVEQLEVETKKMSNRSRNWTILAVLCLAGCVFCFISLDDEQNNDNGSGAYIGFGLLTLVCTAFSLVQAWNARQGAKDPFNMIEPA